MTLVVGSDIRDADGAPLLEGARRAFRVGAPIRSRIDPTVWNLSWPKKPTDPFVVRFDRPLDRTLVQRYLRPIDGHGTAVPGRAALDAAAIHWTFFASADVSDLRLRVDARHEDLAGNSVRRVFDRDLESTGDDEIDAAEIVLSKDELAVPSPTVHR